MCFRIAAAALHRFGDGCRCVALGSRIVGTFEQRVAQLLDDRLRDVVLHGEDVVQRAIVRLRPELVAVGHLHEAHRDAHPVARLSHAAFEQGPDVSARPTSAASAARP